MDQPRDDLGIYIPVRISSMSGQEVLDEITRARDRREAALVEIAKTKAGTPKPKKEKVVDLTKLDSESILTVLAAQLGISVDELKRQIAKVS